MKKSGFVYLFSCVLLIALTAFGSFAQTRRVTGSVKAADGRTIESVTVTNVRTGIAAVTGANGSFSIDAEATDTLEYSGVGYQVMRLRASDINLSVVLTASDVQMEQVVVVGYSRQKKVNLTGAVSVISGSELVKRPVYNTTVALQGTLPGVTVTQFNGVPGSEAQIRIRGLGTLGNNEPLVLIDGVVAAFGDVDPNNIETISVLKDAASASIYGSRAAGGVILITSKRGRSGRMKVDYDAFYGFQQPVDRPVYLDGAGFMKMYNEALTNEGAAPRFTEAQINDYMANNAKDPDRFPSTDWQQATFTNGLQQQHNITLNGGSDRLKLLAAANYMDQNGIVDNSGFKRYSFRFNADYKASDKLSFQLDANLRREDTKAPSVGYGSLFNQVYRVPPIYAAQYSDGSWGPGWEGSNPLAWARASGVNATNSNNILLNLQANYTPFKGLNINFNYAPKYYADYSVNNQKRIDFYNFETKALFISSPNRTTLSNSTNNNLTNYLRLQANYTKSFSWLDVSALVGAEQTDSRSQGFNAYRELTLFPDLMQLNAYPSLNQNLGGYGNAWALSSYYGRVNFVASDKYLLELNSRYDGSSRFAEDFRRYGFFPSFSAGWILTKERFMESVKWMNLLKLRASWGALGNQNIGNYPYISSLSLGQGVFNGNIVSSAAQLVAANREITWESTKVTNLGVDAGFFGNKLNLEFDYYIKNTDDILLTLPIPLTTGLSPAVQNAGKVENKGWDLQVRYNDRIGKDFNYGITAVVSDVKNRVLDLSGTGPYISGFQITQVGQEMNAIFGLQAAGLFQTQEEITGSATQFGAVKPGDIRYVDQNKDGVINALDRVIIGSRIPRYTYSTNLFFEYKGFDLTLFFQGVGRVNGIQTQDAAWAFHNAGSVRDIHLGRWSPSKTPEENARATYPRFFIAQQNNQQASSYWMDDASYVKLKTVALGYTFPAQWIDRTPFSMFKVYVSGQNVYSWDKVPGYDPEAPLGGPSNYPQVASWVAGVRVSLK
ncbi:MAG: SusC/RagA family TonB-linked outer membrane protein [Chitinophagaceae bacterium]